MDRPGFELRAVSKDYRGVRALTGLSLSLPAGRHTAILGASGCGKSTTLRILAGLEAPSAGEVLLNGALLSRTLATRPAFLLLDEPFAGLDLVTKSRLLDEIAALAEEHRFTIVLVTHDPLEVERLCRFAVVLDQGEVQEDGALEALLRQPKSAVLQAFPHPTGRADDDRQ